VFSGDKDAVVIDSVQHGVAINFDAKQIHLGKYALSFGNGQERALFCGPAFQSSRMYGAYR
jgi:hypothetical protein